MTFCRLLTEVLDTTVSTLHNETSNSPAVDTNDGIHNLFAILFGIYLIIQIGFLILISIVAWKKRQRMRERLGRKGWKSSITISVVWILDHRCVCLYYITVSNPALSIFFIAGLLWWIYILLLVWSSPNLFFSKPYKCSLSLH